MLVEAETPDQARHSLLVQNAETVRLVGPAASSHQSPSTDVSFGVSAAAKHGAGGHMNVGGEHEDWQALSVSQLHVGDRLFVRRQAAARHTGISINESITER